jgi:endonuclease YncB( thermonuclease family)
MHAMLPLALAATLLAGAPIQRSTPPSQQRHDLIGQQIDARIVRIADGDTLEAIPAGESRRVRIRLQGVDAPELGEVFGRESMAYLRKLLSDQQVRVHGRDIDRYGRLVARVIVGGRDASVALLRAGLACHAYARDATLAREESQARAAGAGFWSQNAPKPRCTTR